MIFILLSIILLWSTILFEMQNLKRKILFLSKDLMVPLMVISLIFVNLFIWGHKVTFIDSVTEELQRLKNGLHCRPATFLRKYSITMSFQMILWNFPEQPSLTVLSLSQFCFQKMITRYTKQTNNLQANARGTSTLMILAY